MTRVPLVFPADIVHLSYKIPVLRPADYLGPPVKPYTLAALKTLRANLPANIPIIGCGGISTGEDALEYARAGATMVQVYTGFGYDGVGICRRIKDQIVDTLQKEGTTWEAIVKKAVDELSLKAEPEDIKVKPGEGTVTQLIKEAEHINELLDRLGKEMLDHSVDRGTSI